MQAKKLIAILVVAILVIVLLFLIDSPVDSLHDPADRQEYTDH